MKGAYCPHYERKKNFIVKEITLFACQTSFCSPPFKTQCTQCLVYTCFNFGPHGQMIKGRTNLEISVLSSLLQRTITYRTGLRVNSNSNTYI